MCDARTLDLDLAACGGFLVLTMDSISDLQLLDLSRNNDGPNRIHDALLSGPDVNELFERKKNSICSIFVLLFLVI